MFAPTLEVGVFEKRGDNMEIKNEIELKLLDELVRLSHETSEYRCMPDFNYQILEENE